MDPLTQETILFGLLIFVAAFILWLIFRRRQMLVQLQHHRLDMLNRMIDKFGTGVEFAGFLQSEQGKKLLQDASPSSSGLSSTKAIVLRYVQVSVVLLALSFAFFVNASRYVGLETQNDSVRAADLNYWGTLTTCLALGLLFVALITYLWDRKQQRLRAE